MELRVGEAGLLRIGATGATVDSVVMPALRRLLPRRPALRVQLTQGSRTISMSRSRAASPTPAVTPIYADVPGTLHHEPIREDGLCVAASRKHPLASRRKLALRDLDGQRWILPMPGSVARQAMEAGYAEAGLAMPPAALEVQHFSGGALALLAASDLLALMPQSALNGDIAELPVSLGRPLRRCMALVTRHGATWSPLMQNSARRS